MANGSIYIVRFYWTWLGQQCQHVLHFKVISSTGGINAEHLTNRLLDIPTVQWTPLMSNGVKFTSINATEITGNGTDTHTRPQPVGAIGTQTGVAMGSEHATLWTLRTNGVGRRQRGRLYVGGLTSAQVLDGFLTSSAWSSHNTRRSNILARFGSAGTDVNYRWGVYSRLNGGANPPLNSTAFRIITAVDVSRQATHNRKRKIGVGN
jgi:hypothetical protein